MSDSTHRPIEWSTLEEYEGDPDILERMGGGDWNTKPEGFAEKLENLSIPEMKLRRRTFMKLSGFAAVLAAASGCEKPLEHIVPYNKMPEELVVGIPNYYSSTCGGCGTACGTLVKTREGRPIKVEGNPNHKLNQGTLCSKGQTSLLHLYDPDRVQKPGRIKDGVVTEAAWDKLDAEVVKALQTGRAALLTGTIHGPARTKVVDEFVGSFPNVEHVMFEAVSEDARREARMQCYGVDALPQYHFDKAKVTVLLGADPYVDGYSPLQSARGMADQRRVKGEEHNFDMGKLYAFEPMMSMYGMSADYRVSVQTANLLPLAQAIITQLLADGHSEVSGISSPSLAAGATETKLGLEAGMIKKVADDLWNHRGESIVYTGSATSYSDDAVALHVAVNVLNSMLGNEGSTITTDQISNQSLGSHKALRNLMGRMEAGEIDVLLIADANPVYSLPDSAAFVQAMSKVKTKVSFSMYLDETSSLCNISLPGLHFMENWGDAEPVEGYLSIQQPTIQPLWDNRSFEQSLIELARLGGNANMVVEEPAPAGSEDAATERTMLWREFLQKVWMEEIHSAGGYASSPIDFWYATLRSGVLDAPYRANRRAFSFNPPTMGSAKVKPASLELVTYQMANIGDGRFTNNPFLLELPDPVTKICWDNFFALAPATARNEGLKDGDMIEVTADGLSVEGPVRIQPGMHTGVIAAGLGWGRTAAGVVGNGEGFNAYQFGKSGIAAAMKKTGKKIRLADVQGHNFMRKDPTNKDEPVRQIVQATSLELYNKDSMNPQAYYHIPYWNTKERVPDYWGVRKKYDTMGGEPAPEKMEGPNRLEWYIGEHPYVKHKWVMTIDLNACNGCNACMVACQTENNIPVVGKREVLVGREMHWIRIDRYYKGDPENPEVVKMPMLCQHCDNAPCETVCPVLATVHSDEGLNQQVYNRCAGTRYCANNCPYKVRRFNFYQYTNYRKGPHEDYKVPDTPLALALNPEITVRTRGIMEKCSFCSNRIRQVKYDAKAKGQDIPNGAMKTACEQTCPAQAITFGDAMNPDHSVNAVREKNYNKRGYGVLEEFNVQPNVMYLAQIWNRETIEGQDVNYIKKKYHGHSPEHGDAEKGESHSEESKAESHSGGH